MFYDRLPNVAQHIRGSGHRAEWAKDCEPHAPIQPQFLIAEREYQANRKVTLYGTKIGIRSLARATDKRTVIAGVISNLPAGHSINYLTPKFTQLRKTCFVVLSSLIFDWQARMRIVGTNMTFHFLEEMGVPLLKLNRIYRPSSYMALGLAIPAQAVTRLEWNALQIPICISERMRCNAVADALVASAYGLDGDDFTEVLAGCDLSKPKGRETGFWRVDKERETELRHTILTQVAFQDLETKIDASGGNWELGMRNFLIQNHGEGWMLPEVVCLADYGLGDDERAQHPQPVASRLGPRFYDWQLVQTADESWRECHLHARNLVGAREYARLLSAADDDALEDSLPLVAERRADYGESRRGQKSLFPTGTAATATSRQPRRKDDLS